MGVPPPPGGQVIPIRTAARFIHVWIYYYQTSLRCIVALFDSEFALHILSL